MTEADQIIDLVLEAEDDETIKDILGPDYQEPLETEVTGEVYRQDRWADVEIGNKHFCVSYLTPVAVSDGGRVIRTDKNWSTSTIRHIKKWMEHIGFDVSRTPWPEVQRRFPETMPQQKLIELFRTEALRVKWTKRQAKTAAAVPYNKIVTGLRSDRDQRVELDPEHTPKRPWED